eukprot:1142067-Pelagomonas_calceolata.AAC.4
MGVKGLQSSRRACLSAVDQAGGSLPEPRFRNTANKWTDPLHYEPRPSPDLAVRRSIAADGPDAPCHGRMSIPTPAFGCAS